MVEPNKYALFGLWSKRGERPLALTVREPLSPRAMDSLRKLFKKNSIKVNRSNRKKQVRRSRSLPLQEVVNLSAVSSYGRLDLKTSQFEQLESAVPLGWSPDYVLDIAPEKQDHQDLSGTTQVEFKSRAKPLSQLLEEFPPPPSTPLPSLSRIDPNRRPVDQYELAALTGLPAEELLPPNPHIPWVSPATLHQQLFQGKPVRRHKRHYASQAPESIPVPHSEVYRSHRASHSTMTLSVTAKEPYSSSSLPSPSPIAKPLVPSPAVGNLKLTIPQPSSPRSAPKQRLPTSPTSSRNSFSAAFDSPLCSRSHARPTSPSEPVHESSFAGELPVEVFEYDGMWGDNSTVYLGVPRFIPE